MSPFEQAAILSVDGFGDFASAMWGAGHDRAFDVLGCVLLPHSLGMFYSAFSQWLGFFEFGNEGRTMGLVAYRDRSRFAKAMREVVQTAGDAFELNLDYFTRDEEGVDIVRDDGEPHVAPIFSAKLVETFGPARPPDGEMLPLHRDVTAALQGRLEEVYLHLAERLHTQTQLPNLCLAGGVALNAVANARVGDESPFEHV